MQSLARRLENGGVLSCAGVCGAAQPFLAALLHRLFPQRTMVLVTEGLRSQESAQQDLATWLAVEAEMETQPAGRETQPRTPPSPQPSTLNPQPLFYPAWDILPQDARLPHSDVISERLETLVALAAQSAGGGTDAASARRHASRITHHAPLLVTSLAALLQRTFPHDALAHRTRVLARGDRTDPLDLAEWLEEQGYEPEARVTQKGETALRGGILDVYPLTSPWPVRLEFFGDELESLRHFDPMTQVSREEITAVTIPPAGELGMLKANRDAQVAAGIPPAVEPGILAGGTDGHPDSKMPPSAAGKMPAATSNPQAHTLGTLLDYLPPQSILLLCEPELLQERADEYARQISEHDPFYVSWEEIRAQAAAKGMALVEATEGDLVPGISAEDSVAPEGALPSDEAAPASAPGSSADAEGQPTATLVLPLPSIEAYRPLAGAARRNRRWPRRNVASSSPKCTAGCARTTRCTSSATTTANGSGSRKSGRNTASVSARSLESRSLESGATPTCAAVRAGAFDAPGHRSRAAFCATTAKVVVVTDAEIFGRYKVQRPRRLKSPHAQASRSALDIDFTELEEGDHVVHVQHGIGRYVGLQILPVGRRHQDRPTQRELGQSGTGMPGHRIRAHAIPRSRRPSSTCPSPKRIWSANTSAPARRVRRSTRSAARAGRRPRSRPSGPCATSPATCSPSRPRANRSRATPSPRTRPGSASSKARSSSRKRPTSSAPFRRPRPTWNGPSRWTA